MKSDIYLKFSAWLCPGVARDVRTVSGDHAGRASTQDVPADALALGRSRQVVKQGWATRLRGLKSLGKKGRSQ